MTSARSADIELTASTSLTWYRSSSTAERGFCRTCGGNVFWREFGGDTTSITAGTLDVPTGVALERHIFVGDKSDYYDLHDDVPRLAAW
jgi:hypothetical protein